MKLILFLRQASRGVSKRLQGQRTRCDGVLVSSAKSLRNPGVSRRDFGRRVALFAAAGAAQRNPGAAQDGRGPTPLDAAEQAEVDAKYANVIRKYGDRLSDEQRSRVREVLGRHQRMLRRVRTFALDNSDSPATGLRLYPRKD